MTRKEKSYTLGFRVDERMKRVVEEIARREGRSVGEIPREALAEWLTRRYPSLPFEEDKSLKAFLELIKVMKAEGSSWAKISKEVECRFGLKLEKDQLKVFVR